jgi:hypothetical protein
MKHYTLTILWESAFVRSSVYTTHMIFTDIKIVRLRNVEEPVLISALFLNDSTCSSLVCYPIMVSGGSWNEGVVKPHNCNREQSKYHFSVAINQVLMASLVMSR